MRRSHPRLIGASSILLFLSATALVSGQPRGGIVRGTIQNGTTGEAGGAEKVTLFRLSSGMEPIATVDAVSGTFILENVEVAGETPYLLQVTSGGVNYNQRVSFGRGYELEASFTVYDVTRDWKDIKITTARFLMRREHERLRVDKLFTIENETEPQETLYDPEGSFRFSIPSDVLELRSVAAAWNGGMPVPQPASPLPDGGGYFTRTAFKPGTTDFTVSYDVDYSAGGHDFQDMAFYPLAEAMILVAPADIELEAEGWENHGPDPDGRFVVLRRADVPPGTPLEVRLTGGSEHAAELPPPSSEGDAPQSAGTSITVLPDPLRAQEWIVVTLMAAALAYGLLAALIPGPPTRPVADPKTDPLRQALSRLENRRTSGKISTKRYRKEKKEIEARLAKAAGRGNH
jgi:hypothetical protein